MSEYQHQHQQQQQQQQRRSRKRQLLTEQQRQQQQRLQHHIQGQGRQQQELNDLQDKNNRLRIINDDLAICDMAGLVPFTSTFPLVYGYEVSLAMELAIRHLNEGNSSLIPELATMRESCPIEFTALFIDTQRNPSSSFAQVDVLTRTVTDYEYLIDASASTSTSTSTSTSSTSHNFSHNENEITALDWQIRDAVTLLEKTSNQVLGSRNLLPCAIMGAHDSEASKTTALVSGMRGFPQISPASTSDSLDNRAEYPLFGRTMPSDRFATEVFIKYLHDHLNIRHVYVIFESHPYPRSIVRGLRDSIRKFGWAPSRDSDDDDTTADNTMYMEEQMIDQGSGDGGVSTAINGLKRSKFRFVIALVTDRPLSDSLMYTAYENKVAGGDHTGTTGGGIYYWWGFDTIQVILAGRTFNTNDPTDIILAKAYNGYGGIIQTSDKESQQYKLFTEQAHALKQQLYQEHYEIASNVTTTTTTTTSNTTIKNNDRWLFTTPTVPYLDENDWFRDGESLSYEASAYAYDATILIGLSACREVAAKKAAAIAVNDFVAITNNNHLQLTGEAFYQRIKVTNFTGISGYVLLDPDTASRNGNTVPYAIKNYRASKYIYANNGTTTGNVTFHETITDLYRPGGDDNWEDAAPFVYSNGDTILPVDADIPPVKFKPHGINYSTKVVALTLFGVIMTATIGFAIWTYIHRVTRVVRASQPFFLYLVCIGTGILACAIIPMSFDHFISDNSQLACNASIWLMMIGFGITFSALFAKTLRINIIMKNAQQCRRIKLTVRDVLYPVVIIFISNIILLSFMLVYKPITYQIIRTADDQFGRPTLEYGRCVHTDSLPYIIPLFILNLSVVGLAIFQAWRARNLSTEFAESKYIANALLISLIASVLSCPILIVVKDQPDAATFISTALVFVLASSTLGSIFIPKIIYHLEGTAPSSLTGSGRNNSTDFRSGGGSRFTASSTPSSNRFSVGDSGERILTTKDQQTLTKDIKGLERELAAAKKRERILQQRNFILENRQRETSDSTTSTEDTNGGKDEEYSSGDLHKMSEKIKRNNTRNKSPKTVSFSIHNDDSSSLLTTGSNKVGSSGGSKTVSFYNAPTMHTANISSSRRSRAPKRNTGVANSNNSNETYSSSGDLSDYEPKVLMNMVEKLHSPSRKDHKKNLSDLKEERNISDLSLGV